ncbi:MAG: hypothetical protein AB1609_14740 [Bacillota bacterium]
MALHIMGGASLLLRLQLATSYGPDSGRWWCASTSPGRMRRGPDAGVFDAAFIEALPAEVDPCEENGEFPTFVYEGPIFTRPATLRRGRVVQRDGFAFADLLNEQPGRG